MSNLESMRQNEFRGVCSSWFWVKTPYQVMPWSVCQLGEFHHKSQYFSVPQNICNIYVISKISKCKSRMWDHYLTNRHRLAKKIARKSWIAQWLVTEKVANHQARGVWSWSSPHKESKTIKIYRKNYWSWPKKHHRRSRCCEPTHCPQDIFLHSSDLRHPTFIVSWSDMCGCLLARSISFGASPGENKEKMFVSVRYIYIYIYKERKKEREK